MSVMATGNLLTRADLDALPGENGMPCPPPVRRSWTWGSVIQTIRAASTP
jgi:hypothetical protein